ncbi:MAG: methyltransferase domain-containing protein, partial [Gammaproteobacteria bacterium]|nr:methyltransferase domain-containing protein [Gammaproteobacteria bacterium]
MPSEASLATLRLSDVRRRFDKAATLFDEADFVHSVTRNGLLARLEPILIEARTIVDLGCATGSACRRLGKQFRRSHVIGVDLALGMLQQMKRKQSWSAKPSPVQANATALPFADQSIDVIFANLLLPWIDDPARVFKEIARVLRKDGLLLFSTLGPDSLQELRQAWQSVDIAAHVNRFLDMHDIGDAVVGAGLRDPVLDVDRLEVTYSDTDTLFRDLTATGGRNSLQRRNRSL